MQISWRGVLTLSGFTVLRTSGGIMQTNCFIEARSPRRCCPCAWPTRRSTSFPFNFDRNPHWGFCSLAIMRSRFHTTSVMPVEACVELSNTPRVTSEEKGRMGRIPRGVGNIPTRRGRKEDIDI
ncbi:hypothetical protein H4582DRAFT_45480 [Lactarius indigo]|nr:hypothetical protein H4582DRAFT_45480 [Lactarius indigo]